MKILIVVDKNGTAIWRLANSIKRNLSQHEIVIFPVHPKRNDADVMIEAQKLMQWADIIDIHYWKSGQVLREAFPKEFEDKPKMLFHFNPYDAESEENKLYDKVIVGNEEIHNRVPSAVLIPYSIDLSFFKPTEDYTKEKIVNMSVNRIEGKKGVKEVAQACKELGYEFRLVGRVSKSEYIKEVMEVGKGSIKFLEDASDEQVRGNYYNSAIHVCNSTDNFESGTLPILECMACGIPVLTRIVGHVPELYNGSNMVINKNPPEDVEGLKGLLKKMMENRDWRLNIREKAFKTIKGRDDRRMALSVNKLYYALYKPNYPLVSVIIPTKDNPDALVESLAGVIAQSYEKIEILVSDSGKTSVKLIVDEIKKYTQIPVRYIRFDAKDSYSLAEARNRAVIEADGEYLVFCDDRIQMEPEAIAAFVSYRKPDCWLWGVKDGVMKGFVENFSFVHRQKFIAGGMFCERMQWYGGMTEELRNRFEKGNSLNFVFIDEAKAKGIKKSKLRSLKRLQTIEAKFLIFKMYSK